MRRIVLLACLVGACTAVATARAAGTFSVTPGSVAAGGTVTVSFCGFAAGDAGYYTVNGRSVSGTRTWGPSTGSGCLTYTETTTGWAAGKYKFTAFVSTPTGRASRVGAEVVSVSAP